MDWGSEVVAEREARNALYLGPETPLSAGSRAAFQGLLWWPIDPRFRLTGVRLHRHPEPLAGRVGASGPDAVEMLEVGALEFTLEGRPARLLVYEPAPGDVDETFLLIPFRDATTGVETYGAGRYLDLEANKDDVYVLDFNRAYHPYCAYDDAWACTLPPAENRLAVRVTAGERIAQR